MSKSKPFAKRFNQKKPRMKYQWNLLDLVTSAVVVAVIIWLWYRSDVGIQYEWRWSSAFELIFTPPSSGGLPYFFQGLVSTLRLSIWGMLLALVVGTLIGIARHSEILFLRMPANAYIQILRNIPPLVFVFIFYFFISNQIIPALGLESLLRDYRGEANGLQLLLFGPASLWENLLSGVMCVGLLSSAYIAEIVRSGLQNIERGQWEAADSLGLSVWAKYRFIIVPQVIAAITPALAGQTISLVKDSSIVSLISIQELTFVGTEIANSSGLIFEVWLLIGALYFGLCFGLSRLFHHLEKHSNKHLVK